MSESYGSGWKSAVIKIYSPFGDFPKNIRDIHSDGDHDVRRIITDKIQSLEAEIAEKKAEFIRMENAWREKFSYETRRLEKENAELRSKLKAAVEALRNWITWEDEQVRKDGAYVRPEINELIKNGKQALKAIEAQDD
jgi:hypothetical protein